MEITGIDMEHEKRLIAEVIAGETEMFRPLVERFQKPVYRFIRNMIQNDSAAEELTQEVFFRAYKDLRKYDGRCSFCTWLFTIARNCTINEFKRKKSGILTDSDDHQATTAEPSKDAEFVELFRELDRQLQLLPVEQKRVFILAEFEELSHDEIALIEKSRPGTIRARLSRAKEKLRTALDKFRE